MSHKTMHFKELLRVYVFSLPVRVFHWVDALAILVLCVTGFVIGNPPAFSTSHEAYQGYWFGTIRAIHFISAFIFFFNFLFRIYWGFVGNKFERWNNFISSKKKFYKEIWQVILFDILQVKKGERISIGHNALAGFTYFILFVIFVFQIFLGFGLYAAMSGSWIAQLFAWVVPAFGGDITVRFLHHALMWLFVIFTIIHIYLVFYHDYVDGDGELSSMAGGWKFIEKEKLEKHDEKQG
jgi:Ni/Fe-hydrogenase 1 B-type cytochrome subunit